MLKFRMFIEIIEGLVAFLVVIYLLIKLFNTLKNRKSDR